MNSVAPTNNAGINVNSQIRPCGWKTELQVCRSPCPGKRSWEILYPGDMTWKWKNPHTTLLMKKKKKKKKPFIKNATPSHIHTFQNFTSIHFFFFLLSVETFGFHKKAFKASTIFRCWGSRKEGSLTGRPGQNGRLKVVFDAVKSSHICL